MSDKQSFQILRISSFSNLPIRNTANELIFGDHVLWEGKDTLVDDHGLLAPNAFSYDFTSPLSSNSTLNVTLKVFNNELFGRDLILRGSLASDSNKVFKSAVFTVEDAEEITIAVSIVDPTPSPYAVSLKGDFAWAIVPKAQKNSGDQVSEYASTDKTPLELYWISSNIHEIFYAGLSGITVNFLRALFFAPNVDLGEITQNVFSGFSKIYDSASGRSQFNLAPTGGYFYYSAYVAGNPPGSAYRLVNCYDQVAMVQVTASLVIRSKPSWLLQQPFGYINDTYLVGIPGLCNNPFYINSNSSQWVPIDDLRRTAFYNHAYSGSLPTFDPQYPNDVVYDACSGPRLGRDTLPAYINFAIDRRTTLYSIPGRSPSRAGTILDIGQCPGVTAYTFARTRPPVLEADEDIQKLLSKYVTGGNPEALDLRSHFHWDDLSLSVKTLFGDSCNVEYHQTIIGVGVAEEFWHLTGIAGFDGDVLIKVRVHTHIGEDGNLHHERSSRVASEDLLLSLIETEMDLGPDYERLDDIWVAAPTFGDYAKYALQSTPHIPTGKVLLVCGNSSIEISGGSSSAAALEPVVHKLLAHTTVVAPISLHVPHISEHFYDIPDTNKGPNSSNEVKGLFVSFDVICHVDDLIATASADAEGYGVLLSKYNIEKNEDNKTSTVIFTFVTRTVGVHDVHLRFNRALNITTSTEKIQVTVVDG